MPVRLLAVRRSRHSGSPQDVLHLAALIAHPDELRAMSLIFGVVRANEIHVELFDASALRLIGLILDFSAVHVFNSDAAGPVLRLVVFCARL